MKRKLTPLTDPAKNQAAHLKAVTGVVKNSNTDILQFNAVSAARHLKLSQLLAECYQKPPP